MNSSKIAYVRHDDDLDLRHYLNDDCSLFTIAYTSSRYILGTECVDSEDLYQIDRNNQLFSLPVYAYVHSGVALSLGQFGCPWDSGRSGTIYARKTDLAKAYGYKKWCAASAKRARIDAQRFLDYVENLLQGNVYFVQIVDDVTGEELDCYGGIVGDDSLRDVAKEYDAQIKFVY